MKKTLAKASKLATLSPKEIAGIRARIKQTVSLAQNDIDLVLIGEKKWSPVQLGLYKLLLNKIVPDISTTYVEQNDNGTRRISGLSREELEEMVASRRDPIINDNVKSVGKLRDTDDVDDTSDSDRGL